MKKYRDDYDKIEVEIYKVCKNSKSDLFKASFIPN